MEKHHCFHFQVMADPQRLTEDPDLPNRVFHAFRNVPGFENINPLDMVLDGRITLTSKAGPDEIVRYLNNQFGGTSGSGSAIVRFATPEERTAQGLDMDTYHVFVEPA